MPSSETDRHSRCRRPKSKRRSSDRGDYASSSALLLSPTKNGSNSSTTVTAATSILGEEGAFIQRQHQDVVGAGDLGSSVPQPNKSDTKGYLLVALIDSFIDVMPYLKKGGNDAV
uniref:Uncharacterized protein n=1 Tax=Romanomermis culicivorax TaxID=13658 RepID=A0A915IAA8_ROMCU